MLFNSLGFLIFFPIVAMVYFLIGQKYKWVWLLGASYYFYMNWKPEYALLILFSTVTTYALGWFIDSTDEMKKRKIALGVGVAVNLLILFFYKYFNFAGGLITDGLELAGVGFKVPNLDVLLPVGISFYTFQALGYLIDVYRKEIRAEKHFGIYALFVSFFPQLVAGPIERSKNLLPQFRQEHKFDYERASSGLVLRLWVFFKKLVIADRAAILVNFVYQEPEGYEAGGHVVALLLFGVQIYCDFSGYTDIARGAARIMGFDLMDNFKVPYSSSSVTEFWRKWHISLSSWFRDYIYLPLGGNRKGISRTYINLFIVFLISGLWHGAQITMLIWGALHGVYVIAERALSNFKSALYEQMNWNREQWHYKLFHWAITFVLVNFTWLFFRASTASQANIILSKVIHWEGGMVSFGFLGELLGGKNLLILLLVAIMILFVMEHFVKLGVAYQWLLKQRVYVRWGAYVLGVLLVLIYGVYGGDEKSFVYFQF
jgi:D-alanyl-lipoteichoic acid acyltransferase DltB (MBOAT superfamily)